MALTALHPNTTLMIVDPKASSAPHSFIPLTKSWMVHVCYYAFQERGLLVVNVARGAPRRIGRTRQSEPFQGRWTDFIPELDQQPSHFVVTKRSRGSFGSLPMARHFNRFHGGNTPEHS
jgi:hypothetical protein